MTEQLHTPAHDDTAPIGGIFQPAPPAPPRSSRKGLAAAVLAGALVLGGAAGYGGAALFDAQEPDSSPVTSTGGPINASDSRAVAGSVEDVAAKVLPSVVKINLDGNGISGSGSGVVLDEEGHILTNNHVVAAEGASISVSFNDGQTLRAEVVGTDPVTDVAVIKVSGAKDLTPATIGSSGQLKVGQSVVAVGSPYGLNATVTTGIVSALNRAVSVASEQPRQSPFGPQVQQGQDLSTTYPAIQTDAAINPGNSGGPLVDMAGRVVGINSSIRTAGGGLGASEGGNIGLGFAIPVDQVLPVVNQLIQGEKPTHARMAVSVSDVPGDSLSRGALIRTVDEGGPAAEAGLRDGDVVTKVGDLPIDDSESLVATIRGHRPGDEVEITYVRGGDEKTVTVTLGSDAESSRS